MLRNLGLIEKNPSKTAVEEFVKKLGTLNINSALSYPETSFVFRCIKVAATVGATAIRNRIKIDETNLTSFASSNELSFLCENSQKVTRCYKIKLSDVLPEDTQCALYGKVADMFSSITNYRTIFSADSSNTSSVEKALREKLSPDNVIISPAQYLFILLTRWQSKYTSLSYWVNNNYICFGQTQSQIGTTIAQIIKYAFEHDLTEALIQYKLEWIWRQHVRGKFLFSSEYTLESERGFKEIEDWCCDDDKRRDFLKKLDLNFDDCAEIKRRKKFKENVLEEWDSELKSLPSTFLNWVSSLKPINGDKQKELIHSLYDRFPKYSLKRICLESDFQDKTELDSQKYTNWRKAKTIQIYKMDKEMPCQILFDNILLFKDNYGDYHYFPESQHLYIKGGDEAQISGVLTRVYEDRSIPFTYQDYVSVCLGSFEEQKAKDHEIEILKAMLENMQNQLNQDNGNYEEGESNNEEERNEYEQIIRDFLGGSFNLNQYNTNSEHIISSYRILQYLKEQGYQIANDFDQQRFVGLGTYKRIKLENGILVNPASAKWGVWYIHPNVWRDIIENGNWACVCTGNGEYDFEIIKSEEDLKEKAKIATNVLMKLHSSEKDNIMNVISTVFPGKGNEGMDIHLMLKLHNTPNEEFNSLFDKAFNISKNYNLD